MSSRRVSGFTLIEMIVAIVIISVGLAGVLTAFDTNVRASADPMIRKQMLSIAEEMLEEILLKPYAVGPGARTGCNRSMADDIFDYAGYTDLPVCDIDGNQTNLTALSGYTVSVSLAPQSLNGVSMQKITVTAKHGTAESLQLIGWRSDYASP